VELSRTRSARRARSSHLLFGLVILLEAFRGGELSVRDVLRVLWSEQRGEISDMHFSSGTEARLLSMKSYATSSRYKYGGKELFHKILQLRVQFCSSRYIRLKSKTSHRLMYLCPHLPAFLHITPSTIPNFLLNARNFLRFTTLDYDMW
jgi:hypothetical protein